MGDPVPRKKHIHIGAPACFALEIACKAVREAFADQCEFGGIYVVGSCLERADWRDVDVRLMMDDASFRILFPDAAMHNAAWEFDPRWTLMTVAISQWMKAQTGLPIDFQFQPMTFANEHHHGRRNAIGLHYAKPDRDKEPA